MTRSSPKKKAGPSRLEGKFRSRRRRGPSVRPGKEQEPGGEDDRGGAERPAGEEGAGEVQRGRHHRRPQEAGGGADGDAPGEDPHPEVVQHLQGPHHPQGLRDPRRHGPRALLQLAAAAASPLLSGTSTHLISSRAPLLPSIRSLRTWSPRVAY